MRRKDREVTEDSAIRSILEECTNVKIGFKTEDFPYVVPFSFGLGNDNKNPTIYIHCAKEGRKIDCLSKDNRVCVEGEIFHRTEKTAYGITARYESVIGYGYITEVVDEEEKIFGLKRICSHYGFADFTVEDCKSRFVTKVYKIELESVTGKSNLK